MGIPSYFSYIIKNHMRVLSKLSQLKQTTPIHNLYLDCNSIIYDVIREIQKAGQMKPIPSDNFKIVSHRVCTKIQEYIDAVSPSNTVYIAFDGVAPFAKMNQQRTRRFRSAFMEHAGIVPKSVFNSCLITPGTDFMDFLSKHVSNHFTDPKIIVSASDQPGEGEHKLFQHIRDHPADHKDKITLVYGLDADLLMLSIFHSNQGRIFVYREAPEFAKSLNADLESGEPYVLDIEQLCISISSEMNCKYPDLRRVFDYAFLCFLLGNDFLPHFPALNIRTRGIYSLLEAYKETVGKEAGAFIIENGEINWTRFKKVTMWLAKHEDGWIRTEYLKRGEIRFNTNFKNDAEKEAVFNNAPLVYRATEHYINPTDYKWQNRYYKTLFSSEAVTEDICTNYYEGLEWVFRYYTDQCFDWRWKYRFHYPPLLCDLASQSVRTCFFKQPSYNPFSAKTQLAVVLPSIDFDFSSLEFEWAFCRYLWEGHLKIAETDPNCFLL